MLDLLLSTQCCGCGRPGDGRLCDDCRQVDLFIHANPPEGIARAWTLSAYEAPLGHAVRRAKARADRALAVELATLAAARVDAFAPIQFSRVVPAPSAWTTRLARGFSLAALLATRIARVLDRPRVHALTVRPGRQQTGLDRRQRSRNLSGRLRARGAISGHVLLVDDVLTTGATAEACARELLGAGASRVSLFVACAAERGPLQTG